MKSERLLLLLGDIPDEYITEADEYFPHKNHAVSRRRPMKLRVVLAVCMILLLSTFAAAVAVSEDFREAVFSFFRLTEAEEILPVDDEPDAAETVEGIYRTEVEDSVTVDYIRIDGRFAEGNGIIYLYNNEERTDVTFCGVENGELIQPETNRVEIELMWKDKNYSVAFQWCLYNGHIGVYGSHKQPADDAMWYVSILPDNADYIGITLSDGRGETYEEKTFLYEPASGEVIDPLDGCAPISGVIQTTFSPDLTKVLYACIDKATWLQDRTRRTLLTVEEYIGHPVDGCWFADSDHLVYYVRNEEMRYTYAVKSLITGEVRTILENVPWFGSGENTYGIKSAGTRYGLWIDEDRAVTVIDYITGERSAVEKYTYPDDKNMRTIPNNSGTKILFVSMKQGNAQELNEVGAGLEISELGVLDTEKHTFIALDRVGYDARHEITVSWFDDDRVKIRAETDDYGYIYLYTFHQKADGKQQKLNEK